MAFFADPTWIEHAAGLAWKLEQGPRFNLA
jgi:hypothetical protein